VKIQEKQQILKLIHKDFMDIESDLYEYAVYLQSNVLASKLDYEPHPFTEIEALLMTEMKDVNCTIRQNSSFSVEEKEIKMRNFLLKAMKSFKNKVIPPLLRTSNCRS
jgi:hypothetical protein